MNPGDVFGHYRIVELLGKGGMGEVFIAEDTRLHRRVALKVLPPIVAADPMHRERFEREARAVAALNHPNIVTLHSVEELDGRLFLTMELVDGKPLGEIIPRGGLPLDRILRIGIEVADAMAAAQQQGITHRDLKPGNIMIASSGRAKVLDFGLAKLKDAEAVPADDLTRMSPGGGDLTGEGKIVGTVVYMSPEQAEGKPVDPRSDIFSLGVVLHEMATGEKPFKGDTNVSVISSIIKDAAPPVTDSNPALPGDLARIVRRCLAKEPDRRYQTAADLRNELEDLKQDTASGTLSIPRPAPAPARRKIPAVAIVSGVVVLAAAVAAAFALGGRPRHDARPAAGFAIDRLSRMTSTGSAFMAAISPDGRYVVHVKGESGGVGLWMRQTATTSDVRIVPPAEARFDSLTFSPDANYVYYNTYAAGGSAVATLFRVPVLGGAPSKIIEDIDSVAAFSPDQKQMAFLRGSMARGVTELIVADVNGGGERVLAAPPPPDKFQSEGVAWSPDGNTILVAATTTRPGVPAVVYAVDVKSGAAKPTGEPWGFVRDLQWLPDGGSYIATAVDFSGQANPQLWRIPYPSGERSRVTNDLNSYIGASLSADGRSLVTIQTQAISAVYVADGPGKEPRRISGGPGRADGTSGMAWMPDGRLVYSSTATGLPQLWISDADGGNARQLTSMQGPAGSPWSTPDGKWVYFTSVTKDGSMIFRIAPDGAGLEQMTKDGDSHNAIIAPDGKTVYFTSLQTGRPRLMKMPANGGKAEVVSPAYFRANDISPDGTRLLGSGWSEARKRAVIETLHLDGGKLTELEGIASAACFLPDGGLMVPQRVQGKAIITIRPANEKAFRSITPPSGEFIMGGGAVSKDGRVAFARGTQVSDVVLIKAK